MIRLGTLFSGIGAIEQAFLKMQLSHQIVFACDNGERELKISQDDIQKSLTRVPFDEKEKVIVDLYNQSGRENFMEKSYKANYAIDDERFFQDIRFFGRQDVDGEVDIIVGGSPCQAFSSNGKQGGLNDTRGTLFYDYARVINEFQPKCFIFENVRGMVRHDKGRTWKIIKKVFNELNYRLYIQHDENGIENPLLNAVDYGIPQHRQRLFLVGIRQNVPLKNDFEFPSPIPLTTTSKDYLDDIVPAKYYLGKKGFEFVTTHPSRAQVDLDVTTCQKANQQFNWNGTFIFEDLSSKHTNEILARAYVGQWNFRTGVIRKFTPRESLRLMGFPDSFKIVVNDTMMWRQCGNSIVVNVLEAIMKQLIKTGIFEI